MFLYFFLLFCSINFINLSAATQQAQPASHTEISIFRILKKDEIAEEKKHTKYDAIAALNVLEEEKSAGDLTPLEYSRLTLGILLGYGFKNGVVDAPMSIEERQFAENAAKSVALNIARPLDLQDKHIFSRDINDGDVKKLHKDALINLINPVKAGKPAYKYTLPQGVDYPSYGLIKQEFAKMAKGEKQSLDFLRAELANPESPIWEYLGELIDVANFDSLPDGSKHLDLLGGRAFLESGGLDMLFLWIGRNFYDDDRISIARYLRNLKNKTEQEKMLQALNLNINMLQPNNPDYEKIDPNLRKAILVQDYKLNEKLNTWRKDGNDAIVQAEDELRTKTNSIGLLTRLLLHSDIDSRLGSVSRSQPIFQRLFKSKFIANLLIMLEKSRTAGELNGRTRQEVWKILTDKTKILGNNTGDSLLSGLKIDVDDGGLVSGINYRDFTKKNNILTDSLKPDKKEYEQVVWTQFFNLFFEALEESGYFKTAKKSVYPYFLPTLILQGYIILSDQEQGYVEVLNSYVTKQLDIKEAAIKKNEQSSAKLLVKENDFLLKVLQSRNIKDKILKDAFITKPLEKTEQPRLYEIFKNLDFLKTNNTKLTELESFSLAESIQNKWKHNLDVLRNIKEAEKPINNPDLIQKLQYELFDATNFFSLKDKIQTLITANPELANAYLNKGYVLHYLSTKGIRPQSQITTDYITFDKKKTPSYTNCVEAGIFNFFGLFLPFNQITGKINLEFINNKYIKGYLENEDKAGKKVKLKDFNEKFLVDQPWLPYINLGLAATGKQIDSETLKVIFDEPVIYIKLPKANYDFVRDELKEQSVKDQSVGVELEYFKISYKDITDPNNPSGCDVVFIKENPELVFYELESGFMTFYLFEQMILNQNDHITFTKIMKNFPQVTETDISKIMIFPNDFQKIMHNNYKLNANITSTFSSSHELWRGECTTVIDKIDKINEPLTTNLNINLGHTDVKFIAGTQFNLYQLPNSLPDFFERVFYSESQKIEFDNFDCQHWMWLVPSVFDPETINYQKWDQQANEYKNISIGDRCGTAKDFKEFLEISELVYKIEADPKMTLNQLTHPEKEQALRYAAEHNLVALIEKLNKCFKIQPDLKALYTTYYNEPMRIAAQNGNAPLVWVLCKLFKSNLDLLWDLFINTTMLKDNNPIQIAARFGNVAALEAFIKLFKNQQDLLLKILRAKNFYKDTILHIAAKHNNNNKGIALIKSLLAPIKDNEKLLTEFLINTKDGNGLNPVAMFNDADMRIKLKEMIP